MAAATTAGSTGLTLLHTHCYTAPRYFVTQSSMYLLFLIYTSRYFVPSMYTLSQDPVCMALKLLCLTSRNFVGFVSVCYKIHYVFPNFELHKQILCPSMYTLLQHPVCISYCLLYFVAVYFVCFVQSPTPVYT